MEPLSLEKSGKGALFFGGGLKEGTSSDWGVKK